MEANHEKHNLERFVFNPDHNFFVSPKDAVSESLNLLLRLFIFNGSVSNAEQGADNFQEV